MPLFDVERGMSPLVISFPHVGTELPLPLRARLTPVGRTLVDTDWYVDRLYAFARDLDITTIVPRFSRYVVDLNRDPNDKPLYPGARTSTVCPTETFEGDPLYTALAPGPEEVAERITAYWKPYHAALAAEIARVKALHGSALLLDAHSIWGRLPLLFDGQLPDMNIGTNSGRSCAIGVTNAVAGALRPPFPSLVIDDRFKGGYITRTYGSPNDNVHAIQIEINQGAYLAEGSRNEWSDKHAKRLIKALRTTCEGLLAFARAPV